MPTLDLQDGLEPTSSPSRSRLSGGLSQRVDRRYLVGCVAGVLLGGALAVPAAYALLRASPARDNGAVGRGESLSTLMSAGLDALARKDDARALELFRRATQAFPKNAPAHNNVCVALNELGRYEEAVPACEAALALQPGFRLAATNLAWARARIAETVPAPR